MLQLVTLEQPNEHTFTIGHKCGLYDTLCELTAETRAEIIPAAEYYNMNLPDDVYFLVSINGAIYGTQYVD